MRDTLCYMPPRVKLDIVAIHDARKGHVQGQSHQS